MHYLLLLGLIGLISCSSPDSISGEQATVAATPQRELVQVKGSTVSFRISTFTSVSCIGYERQFPNATRLLITDPTRLKRIQERVEQLQPARKEQGVDIRAKTVLLYNDHSSDTLCLGQFYSVHKGRIVPTDSVLNRLLGIGL